MEKTIDGRRKNVFRTEGMIKQCLWEGTRVAWDM
jgi:hypothetical protein